VGIIILSILCLKHFFIPVRCMPSQGNKKAPTLFGIRAFIKDS